MFAELMKLISIKKVRYNRDCNIYEIEETLKNGRIMKTTKERLSYGSYQLFTLKAAKPDSTYSDDDPRCRGDTQLSVH